MTAWTWRPMSTAKRARMGTRYAAPDAHAIPELAADPNLHELHGHELHGRDAFGSFRDLVTLVCVLGLRRPQTRGLSGVRQTPHPGSDSRIRRARAPHGKVDVGSGPAP